MEERTESRRTPSPAPADGEIRQPEQTPDRSKSPAQQTQPLAGETTLPPEAAERVVEVVAGEKKETKQKLGVEKKVESGASSPPAATGDRSRPSSPTAQQTAPSKPSKEMAEAVERRCSSSDEVQETGSPATVEVKVLDAADEPTGQAGASDQEEEKAGEEDKEAEAEEAPADVSKPAPAPCDEEEKAASPTPKAKSPSPSPAAEPEEVTKTTSANRTEKVDESGGESTTTTKAATVVAMETAEATEQKTAASGAAAAAAVVIDEPRRLPEAQEQSRRSRSNRSHSSSSSGSSASSGSDSTSASGRDHSSDGEDGGSLPKKVKLEPVEAQQQQQEQKEQPVDAETDGQVQQNLREANCTSPSDGGETSILKARIEQRTTTERPAGVTAVAKTPSQTPSREQSSVRSSLNSEGSISPRVVTEEEETEATVAMENAGRQSGTPSGAVPLLLPSAPASVASSRACSPSLASSSAQSTPTKDKVVAPTDKGGGGLPPAALKAAVKTVVTPPAAAAIVVGGLEKPDSAWLTADLQSCKRQLAEVRSKYDVTRKELHATKRKLKRMSVRLSGLAASNAAATGVSGANSPHMAAVAAAAAAAATPPSEEDRNRKWREPMILSAMKIKAAMGIQAYKSLIKDGELLLPSLRTITRYLESLRKAGGGNGLAVAAAIAAGGGAVVGGGGAGAKPSSTNATMLDVDDEDEEDDEEDDVMLATPAVADQGNTRRKLGKMGADGVRRTVDHNRNEQQQQQRHGNGGTAMRNSSGQYQSLHQHASDVHLQDIKTEPDPVSFTASPDINYYQHNANDDEDDDEDGYQDPTSLLEQSRYDGDGGVRLNGDDAGYQQQQYAAHQANQQQTLTQAQIEFLKSMVGFRKKWTPYELRTCNEIRHIIGSREYDSLRKNDGMPLPSVKTLRKYRNAEQVANEVDAMGRKRKHNETLAEESSAPVAGDGQHKAAEGGPYLYGSNAAKMMKVEQDSEDGHFDVGVLTKAQISFLKTLSLNTKGFSDYELQRSLELKNELGSKNYETLRKQEFLNIPTLVMLTRYEQDNGLEDLSRMAGTAIAVDDDEHDGRGGDAGSVELMDDDVRHTVDEEDHQAQQELQHSRQQQQQQQLEEEQAREQQQQQQQLELYNRLTQADPTRHPLFDSIAGDISPADGTDPAATAAAIAAAMAAAAASMHQSLDMTGGAGDDSSLGIFENHSIFDKDSPTFDMSKLSPAHVEFLNTLPENPKRWTQEMINSALDIKNEIGTRDYEILRRQGIPLPAARTLRRHKDIRNKADRAMSEPGEILPGGGATAGVVGSG